MTDTTLASADDRPSPRPPRSNGPLVLVIEDSATMGQYIQAILASVGCQVELAANGEIGLQKVLQRLPALILLDLQMPGMDGLGVLRRLKSRPPYNDIPVIVLTARQTIDDVTMACSLGARDYMTKPFEPGSLIAKVAKHVPAKVPRADAPRP